MNLLRQHIANGRRFAVSSYVESGDQVSVTLTVTSPAIPDSVSMTKIFTFASGSNTVVQMNDGLDVLALRALWGQQDEDYDEDGE